RRAIGARTETAMPAALKSFVQWLVYAVLVVFAGGLILLGKADAVLVERVRLQVSDSIVPILDALSRPADVAADGLDWTRRWIDVAGDNERLRRERDELLRWQTAAKRLEAENAGLRQLLNYVPEPPATYRSARVVADSSGVFAQSVTINAGSAAGIDKGQIVLDGAGLVGRVVGVSPRAGRVLLLTDLNSRVPVFVGPSRIRAVLAGDNTHRPKLIHVVPGETINAGDDVVTSGIAGGFPPGLAVGVVVDVADRRISVAPSADNDRLEYVRVADFGTVAAPPGRPDAPEQRRGDTPPAAGKPVQRADAR
ncbi:MAG TPA: rod shape-determining protein MreC, partial [Rhodospirillales bacterium]|nr:rod shape-determining protein MreC [Rhodospirillales bacterium]